MKIPGFVGPSYLMNDVQFDNQRVINWVPTIDEMGTGMDGEPLHYTERYGKTVAFTTTGTSTRGEWTDANGTGYVVSDNKAYVLSGSGPTFTATVIGTLLTTVGPVDINDFGGLVCFVDGPYGYQYQGGVFSQITDPNFQGATCVTTFDGAFVFNVPNTNEFYWSNFDLTLGLVFDALNFDTKDGNSDPINTIRVFGRQMWIMGTQTGEIWVDNPSGNTQFQRIPGPYLQVGAIGANTFCFNEYAGFFISTSVRGGAKVYMTAGYTIQRISTYAIEQQIQLSTNTQLINSTAFTFEEFGHLFYQINIPGQETSFVYDITGSQNFGKPLWHERSFTDFNGRTSRDLADNHCFVNGIHLFGDYSSGNVYYGDPNNWQDNGNTVKRRRVATHFTDEMNRIYVDSFTLKGRTGTGIQGAGPLTEVSPYSPDIISAGPI